MSIPDEEQVKPVHMCGAAACFEYPTGGEEAVQTALDILTGKKVPRERVLSSRVYTRENIDAGGEPVR